MVGFWAVLLAFAVGGVTLVPVLAALALGLIFYASPVVHVPNKTGLVSVAPAPEDESEPVRLYRAGWLTVRRTYEPLPGTDGTYVGALVSGYRSLMDNRGRADGRKAKVRERFYGVLKLQTLFLYENNDQVDCWAAIDLSQHRVSLYPDVTVDGELFVKRNAIALVGSGSDAQSPLAAHKPDDQLTHDLSPGKNLPWFIFTQVNSDKEDWLHSLIEASKLGADSTAAQRAQDKALFDPEDMARLVDGIDQQPDAIPMRWMNALLGRLFLSVYRTDALESYLISRIVRKLKRVKTPNILSEIKVREVNVGTASPLFSKPMLKELTAEGDASVEVHVAYAGEMRVTIETVATISLPKLKPYSVRLVLAVCLKEIEGNMLFKLKRPPSNRLWFAFQQMPRIVLDIQPVVSTRQIKWSLVTSPIESRIREVILESLVVPHMDDLAFFDTSKYADRGGIWGDALRKEFNLDEDTARPQQPNGEGENVATKQGAPMEEEGDDTVRLATSVEAEESAARMRPRRRRSSEGDRSELAFTEANPTAKNGAGPSSGATTARSTLSGSATSMYAAWKESRNPDKKRTWFGPKAINSPGGNSSPAPTSGTASPGSRQRASTLDPASGSSSPVGSPSLAQADQDSANRLRDLLAARAAERKKKEEEEEENAQRRSEIERAVAAAGVEEPMSLEQVTEAVKEAKINEIALTPPSETPTPSALSLTAPARSISTERDTSPAASIDSNSTVPLLDLDGSLTSGKSTSLSESPATSLSNFPISSTSSTPGSSTPPSLSARPPVPPRPNQPTTDVTPPPPPPRRQSHLSTASADAGTSSSAALLNVWRTKAGDIDKQALAAGVASAREGLKKWSAGWGKKNQQQDSPALEEESPVIDGGRVLPSTRRQEGPSYREHRSRPSHGAYFATPDSPTLSSGSTPPIAIGASSAQAKMRKASTGISASPEGTSFTPPKATPTTQLSDVRGTGSPTSGPSTVRTYQAQSRMAIPGIRTEQERMRVASDHVEAPRDESPPELTRESAAIALLKPAWLGAKAPSGVSSQGASSVEPGPAAESGEAPAASAPSEALVKLGEEPSAVPATAAGRPKQAPAQLVSPSVADAPPPAPAPTAPEADAVELTAHTPVEGTLPVMPLPEGPVEVEGDLLKLEKTEAVPTTPSREIDADGWGFEEGEGEGEVGEGK